MRCALLSFPTCTSHTPIPTALHSFPLSAYPVGRAAGSSCSIEVMSSRMGLGNSDDNSNLASLIAWSGDRAKANLLDRRGEAAFFLSGSGSHASNTTLR